MAAHRYGEKTAIVADDGELSFAAFDERARSVSAALREQGLDPGERVALYLPNTLQFPETLFGAIDAGAVPVPLNLRMDVETLTYILEDADVEHLVSSPLLAGGLETERSSIAAPGDLVETADVGTHYVPGGSEDAVDYEAVVSEADPRARPERDPDDIAIQTYTSGTTGDPKGVLLSHRNFLAALEGMDTSSLGGDPDDAALVVLPLFHIPTLTALLGTSLYTGATAVLQAIPDPELMLAAIEEHDITNFSAVPALHTMMYRTWRENPDEYDVSSVESLGSAAAPLPEDTRRGLTEEWGVVLSEGWGMTETTSVFTQRSPLDYKEAGCVGKVVRNAELKLVDPETRETRVRPEELDPWSGPPDLDFSGSEHAYDGDAAGIVGEIAVRGPQVFEGYHGLPEKNEAVFDDEGWFYTEDIARVDPDGDIWMVDRADDMIIAGGENVYPAEVEDAVVAHPDITEAVVVPVPDEQWGQVGKAVVEGDAALTLSDLADFLDGRLAGYKHPKQLLVVEELPTSGPSKIDRAAVEARFGAASE